SNGWKCRSTSTSPRTRSSARSSEARPMAHQGQTTSETKSTRTRTGDVSMPCRVPRPGIIGRHPPETAMSRLLLLACVLLCNTALAQSTAVLSQAEAYTTRDSWRQPTPPVRIADHTWNIGTVGLSALLFRTEAGAILIDGGVPQAADLLLANMQSLGVAPADLKLVLSSHAHGDHVGPLAAVKRATGAR